MRYSEYHSILQCLLSYPKFVSLSAADYDFVCGIAEEIELSIYSHATKKAIEKHIPREQTNSQFFELYSNIAYNIKSNLDINSTVNESKPWHVRTYLVNSIYNFCTINMFISSLHPDHLSDKEIASLISENRFTNPSSVGEMSSIQLNPILAKPLTDEIEYRKKQNYSEKYSTMYTCGKCKGNRTKEKEVQKRSLDEGGTLIVTCIDCGHRWSP